MLDGALATVARLTESRGLDGSARPQRDLPPVVVNRLALRHILLNVLGYLAESGRVPGACVISAEARGRPRSS